MALDTLTRVVRIEKIGELPEVLLAAVGWQPEADDRALDKQARDECARLGWLDHRGHLDVDVASALRVLCLASTEVYGWITVGRTTTGVLACSNGRQALLAIRHEPWVSLCSIKPGALTRSAIAQAPDVPTGPGKPIQVRRSDALAFDGGRPHAHGGVAVRPVPLEVRRLTRIADLQRTGAGEFHVAVRDAIGRRRSSADPVGYVDTVAGRYVTVTATVDGEAAMLLAPTSHRDLVTRLDNTLSSLTT
ncbi:ESX secretion-associated protein EspG [Kibdelosporangium phytohabitans]|uniref:ESX secretion-associated protein EspG n=1 Tax=Kibdelosporangium phytohabitans TaxID=860235 RepID=UPI00214E1D65|nr:ESX secretion-associated protein EspG [Kibdelosporangium phytohabitans]